MLAFHVRPTPSNFSNQITEQNKFIKRQEIESQKISPNKDNKRDDK